MINVLHCHNYYKFKGGEDIVVELEREALQRSNRINLVKYNVSQNSYSKLKLILVFLFESHFNSRSFFKLLKLLKKNKVQILHAHNTHFILSPSVLVACWMLNVKVIITLHNYRFLHPSATLFRDRKELSDLLIDGRSFYKGSFFNNSRLLTWKLCLTNYVYRKVFNLLDSNIQFICVSKIVKDIYSKDSVFNGKLNIIHNFITSEVTGAKNNFIVSKPEKYVLFLGRLEEEKGILRFIEMYMPILENQKIKLVICGDGSEFSRIKNITNNRKDITLNSFVSGEEKKVLIQNCLAFIVPSVCHETFGMTILEGFNYGKPAIVSSLVGKNNIVQHEKNGFIYSDGRSLEQSLLYLKNETNYEQIARNCKLDLESRFSSSTHTKSLIELYENLLSS